MQAVVGRRLELVEVLAVDQRVDLDTVDSRGRSLEERARRWLSCSSALKSSSFVPFTAPPLCDNPGIFK